MFFPARDGLFVTNFLERDQELSEKLAPLFDGTTVNDYAPIDWARASDMSLAIWKDRLYFGYVDTLGTRLLAVLSFTTQQWFHYLAPVQSLLVEEDLDQLVMGSTDGVAYTLEDQTVVGDAGSGIALTVETAERGDRAVPQRWEWLRVDADVPSGTLTATLLVDNVARATVSITGNRTRRLQRLPAGCLGHTARVKLEYTGTAAVKIYGVSLLGQPLGVA